MDQSEDRSSNPRAQEAETIQDLVSLRLSRRDLLRGGLAALGATVAAPAMVLDANAAYGHGQEPAGAKATFGFGEITRGMDGTHHVPDGYSAQLLIRWGDPVFPDSPSFDPLRQTADSQGRQFGYNNDFIGYRPLALRPGQDERGLLCVNHEYTSTVLMFPDLGTRYPAETSAEQCAVEMAAHGGSVLEVYRVGPRWSVNRESPLNRRITAHATPMEITGPAAGHERLRTGADPTGRLVAGTMNNCAGGITPWGTYLMAEENFNGNFMGQLPEGHPEAENHARYDVPSGWYVWGRHVPRFDVGQEPQEPNRFGWIVEVDLDDPESRPKKRTALGRFKHEGAETVLAPDGRVVVYMGDDQRFDYVYKFVSNQAWDPQDPTSGRDLLDAGVLYVARFEADGTVHWLPLVHGQGPLTAANGFASQADVLISARLAADALGATPMDRPEDVEPDPSSGSVWVMLTNNHLRTEERLNAANPRARNLFGHIIQIIEPDGDFAATRSRWEFLVRCGDPDDPAHGAVWNPATSRQGWFGSPDNCAVDPTGRLWVATDGNEATGANDGLWALETTGPLRGTGRAFFRAPLGAEVCGPRFTPGGDTLFLSVQHPGDGRGRTFDSPATRWPDFEDDKPPRPAVLAIRRDDGGPVGA